MSWDKSTGDLTFNINDAFRIERQSLWTTIVGEEYEIRFKDPYGEIYHQIKCQLFPEEQLKKYLQQYISTTDNTTIKVLAQQVLNELRN